MSANEYFKVAYILEDGLVMDLAIPEKHTTFEDACTAMKARKRRKAFIGYCVVHVDDDYIHPIKRVVAR